MVRSMQYLSVLRKFKTLGLPPQGPVSVPPMTPVPTVPWLISVYVRDALSRLEETKARVTSVFGDILKMDSTKKMTKKLAGSAAGTAAWVTNVGNEHGQVLMSVLTAAEGDGLLPMAAGLMQRYREAQEPPPRVLYVDRECCSLTGQTKVAAMFHEWDRLVVRLDVWHFMRRFARGVTTESHHLYGQFMARLSYSIFEWDKDDLARLEKANMSKEGERVTKLSPREVARHCCRRTRGVPETERLIQELLDAFWDVRDDLGMPLIDHAQMEEIWSTQRRHLNCIQDPQGVELYTKTGEIRRGGIRLPVYRCARGSTSLESFHLHLCRFIPGNSASALHFQVYLLEGLARWNENHASAAVEGAPQTRTRCYNARLQHSFDQLTQEFMGHTMVENYTKPREYTGELIGVEYLFSQTGVALQQDWGRDPEKLDDLMGAEEDWDSAEEEDEGFEELEDICFFYHDQQLIQAPQPLMEHNYHQPATAAPPASVFRSGPTHTDTSQDDTSEMEVQLTEKEDEDVIGPDGLGGYQHVTALAHALVELRHQAFVTQHQAWQIVELWLKLTDRDKAAVSFPPCHQDRLVKGRFKTSRSAHTPGVDSVQRAFLGKGAGAAQTPKASRLVEAMFVELCQIHYEGHTIAGVRVNRWGVIMREYNTIRDIVVNCQTLMANTSINLFLVNQRTLMQWHTERSKQKTRKFILSAIPGPSAPATAAQSLPPHRPLLTQPVKPKQPFHHHLPDDASGQAATHRGPLAPALYHLISGPSATEPSSSNSTSATSTTTSSTITTTTSTISGTADSASTTSTAASASPSSSAPHPVPPTTAWQRKMREQLREEEERRAQLMGVFLKSPRKNFEHYRCRRCGQPKTKQYGHSRYKGEHFCSKAEGRSVEDWLEEKKRKNPDN